MIDVTGIDLKAFIRAVYRLSAPAGMGYIHYEAGELDDETVDSILGRAIGRRIVAMEYVKGRACKIAVWRDIDTGNLHIQDTWYDHTYEQFKQLLAEFGIDLPVPADGATGWGLRA